MAEPRSFGCALGDGLGPGELVVPAVGLRHDGDRRGRKRRSHERTQSDRRRSARRKARVRNLLFSALAVALPPQIKPAFNLPLKPGVSVSVGNFEAIPPREAYEGMIREAAETYDLDPVLIRSVIETESAFDPSAVSRAGAVGLMQLMPAVAANLGVQNLLDPRENIMGGAQLLRELIDRYDGNMPLVLASYNAGVTAVARFGRIPPFPETQAYVKKVTRLIQKSRETGAD
jgi:soluble lytic murein transglycosylase-like protein